MILPEDQINFRSRLHYLTDVVALQSLCHPEAITRLENTVESLNTKDQRGFLRGYRLAVATPLFGLLYFTVNFPELLSLESDERLFNWFHYRDPEKGESLLHAVSNPRSGLGRLCFAFDILQTALREAEGKLVDTVAALEKCQATAMAFSGIVSGTEIVHFDTGEELLDGESFFPLVMAERVLDYAGYDRSIVRLARRMVWHSSGGVPKAWSDGFRFGLDSVVRLNRIELPSHSESSVIAPTWFDELHAFVNPFDLPDQWPSMKYGLTELSQSQVEAVVGHFEASIEVVSPKSRVAVLLGSDEVHLISDAGATDSLELEVMLRGAIAVHGDSRVRILLLTHTVESDTREWVSIAVRLPMYGIFSNASKWFLFHKIYHAGRVFDSDVAHAKSAVNRLLSQFKNKLELEELNGLSSDDFLHFCEPSSVRAMRDLNLKAIEANAALRSGNSELLAGFWLVGQGYHDVKVSFRHTALDRFEYDAIGIKDKDCLVIEVKGAEIIDHKLDMEISRFASKIERLRSQSSSLAKALGCEVESVSGLFVFLGDFDDFKPTDTSIPLWGYEDFVGALKEAGLPNRLVKLLDKSYIIHSIDIGGLFDYLRTRQGDGRNGRGFE